MGEPGGEGGPSQSTPDQKPTTAQPDAKASSPNATPKPDAPPAASSDTSPVFGPEVNPNPSPNEADAGSATDPESSGPSEIDARRTRSEQVTTTLLDQASEKWKSGLGLTELKGLSRAQLELYIYRQLKDGFPEESYVQKNSDGNVTSEGKSINLTATDTKGDDVELVYVTEGKTVDEKRVYECLARDPNDSSRLIPVEVPGDELARRHLAKAADDITTNFSGNEQAVVKWYAEGSVGDPPSDEQLAAIEESADPLKITDKIIDGQMNYLADKITTLKASLTELAENDPNRAKITNTIAEANNKLQQLDRSQALKKVEELGEGQLVLFAKTNTLRGVQSFANEQGDQVLANGIETRLEELKPQLTKEREQFKGYLKSQGISDEALALADNPDKLVELMNHPEIKALPDIMKTMFGTDEIESQKLLNDYIDNIPLSAEQNHALKNILKTGGKNALLAVLIALAVGVGAAAIGGLAAAETVGGLAKAA